MSEHNNLGVIRTPLIGFRDVSFTYAGSSRASIEDVCFTIPQGSCIVFTGPSGSGKTTITRLINGLAPSYFEGVLSGEILLYDQPSSAFSLWQKAQKVASVFQEPLSQFFTSDLYAEIAFGCENLGMEHQDIVDACARVVELFSLAHLKDRDITTLSSGQAQLIAIASAVAPRCSVLVMDEPTANLDSRACRVLGMCLAKLKERGTTIVIAEHRIAWLKDIVDEFLYVDNGRITKRLTPQEMGAVEDYLGLGIRSFKEEALDARLLQTSVQASSYKKPPLLRVANCSMQFGRETIFSNMSCDIYAHEICAIKGANGSGKTTLARIMAGLLKPTRGSLLHDEKHLNKRALRKLVWYSPNLLTHAFFGANLVEEVTLGLPDEQDVKDEALSLLSVFGLIEQKDMHPYTLSGGQKARLSLACGVMSKRPILVLDEPTSGLDGHNMRLVSQKLKDIAHEGRGILVITHDVEFINCCADRVIDFDTSDS